MKKEKLSLITNGSEYLRIENGKYYICKEPICDWFVMCEVRIEEFKKELKKFKWCLTCWDKNVREQYLNILEEVK